MNKVLGLLLVSTVFLSACMPNKSMKIALNNPSVLDRTNEIIELPLSAVTASLIGDVSFIITNEKGEQIPYQVTYDQKLIFPVTVTANGSISYFLKPGVPEAYAPVVFGKHYPERLDDIAWENDRIAFRTYGPALQASGEKAYGYDIWVKRVPEPVVQERYRKELEEGVSYHNDNGNGLDYFKVGPTLGAGTSALLVNDTLVYPYCYDQYEILDNGPLRFTVKLVYKPLTINDNKSVIETRFITLDAYTHLNRVSVSYTNLNEALPLATGIVTHDPSEEYVADAASGYIAYAEVEDKEHGRTFVGAVFPNGLNDTRFVRMSDAEAKERGASGHVLAINEYRPGTTYTYYAGGGWSKWGFENAAVWFEYVKAATEKIRKPITVSYQ